MIILIINETNDILCKLKQFKDLVLGMGTMPMLLPYGIVSIYLAASEMRNLVTTPSLPFIVSTARVVSSVKYSTVAIKIGV